MVNTHFRDNFNEVVKGQAYGYARDGAGFRLSVTNFDTAGATSLLTTAEDLAKWNATVRCARRWRPGAPQLRCSLAACSTMVARSTTPSASATAPTGASRPSATAAPMPATARRSCGFRRSDSVSRCCAISPRRIPSCWRSASLTSTWRTCCKRRPRRRRLRTRRRRCRSAPLSSTSWPGCTGTARKRSRSVSSCKRAGSAPRLGCPSPSSRSGAGGSWR